ncbi:MAG: hypothetical protein AB2696_21210 [Candidatus Thiodiazotropha sp.]
MATTARVIKADFRSVFAEGMIYPVLLLLLFVLLLLPLCGGVEGFKAQVLRAVNPSFFAFPYKGNFFSKSQFSPVFLT